MSRSVRARRAARIAQAMDIVGKLTAHTRECDGNWMTRRLDYDTDNAVWLTTPFSVNGRGDEPLAESNYRVIRADLERLAGMDIDYRVDAWVGGTIETLMVRADDALAIRAVQQWAEALADYPVADESDLSEVEWEHNHPTPSECYSEEPDCPCDVVDREYFPAEEEEEEEE